MEVGFGIPNAGPLAQISLQLFSPEMAVYLATGAYGWWKSRERTKSLVEVLAASNTQLSSPSTFNWQTYQRARETGKLQGVVVQSGQVQVAVLPKASTALPPNAALACLRALTTGLLCFYGVDTSSSILAAVIPRGLLQYDQEGVDLVLDGPRLSSLKLLVSAVAAEEDSNTLRQYLMDQVTTQQRALRIESSQDIFQVEGKQSNEVWFVVGLLEWIITPTYKRKTLVYPTRSLLVWTMAAVLAKLGFEISASPSVVRSAGDYERLVTAQKSSPYYADVVLVLEPAVETDPLLRASNVAEESLRPQISPLQAVPWLMFRRFRGHDININTQYLADIWNMCFNEARNFTMGIERSSNGYCKISVVPSATDELSRDPVTSFQKALVAEWSVHLLKICGRSVKRFIPPVENSNAGWSVHGIRKAYKELHIGFTKEQLNEQVAGNCRIIIAIVLGTLYGAISKCVIENERHLDLDTSLAIGPDDLYVPRKLEIQANQMGHGIDGMLSPADWIELVLALLLRGPPDTSELHDYRRVTLGAHFNGITAVSDALVHPSPRPSNLIRIHVQRGQILNIPISDGGLIHSANPMPGFAAWHLDPDPGPSLTMLQRNRSTLSPEGLRIDVEPWWEGDLKRVVFMVRKHGTVVATISISDIFNDLGNPSPSRPNDLDNPWVSCSCGAYADSVPVPVAHRWQHVGMHKLFEDEVSQLTVNEQDKILVDASASEEALLVAVGRLRARKLKISLGCLQCTYRSIRRPEENESVVIIAARWGPGRI